MPTTLISLNSLVPALLLPLPESRDKFSTSETWLVYLRSFFAGVCHALSRDNTLMLSWIEEDFTCLALEMLGYMVLMDVILIPMNFRGESQGIVITVRSSHSLLSATTHV